MSFIEWFFIGLIILFFVIIVSISVADLIRDLHFYRDRKKNVKQFDRYKKNKQVTRK